jgi:hypothetical protein
LRESYSVAKPTHWLKLGILIPDFPKLEVDSEYHKNCCSKTYQIYYKPHQDFNSVEDMILNHFVQMMDVYQAGQGTRQGFNWRCTMPMGHGSASIWLDLCSFY